MAMNDLECVPEALRELAEGRNPDDRMALLRAANIVEAEVRDEEVRREVERALEELDGWPRLLPSVREGVIDNIARALKEVRGTAKK